jgi:pimeloyl-ACP methyl ester carboxylesterase
VARTVTDDPITVLGFSQGAAYAADRPERVSRLILHGGFARGRLARATTAEERAEAETMCQLAEQGWAKEDGAYRQFFTTQILPAGTPEQQQWFNELQRVSASPAIAARYMRVFNSIDVTELLTKVQCPHAGAAQQGRRPGALSTKGGSSPHRSRTPSSSLSTDPIMP